MEAGQCSAFFVPGRGVLVRDARTLSSDPDWKYVNVRRTLLFIDGSIDVRTQWAVFEPNGQKLRDGIRQSVEGFLCNQWKSGGLLDTIPKEAFFVRCDHSTMTQNDMDDRRVVCLVGVATHEPTEFVISRIGQKTAAAT